MVEPASWSCAWSPAAPGRCSFSRCSSVAPATGDAPVHSRSSPEVGEWKQPPAVTELVDLGDADGRAAEALLYQSLRSDVPELRTASVTALASLARPARLGDRRPRRGARGGEREPRPRGRRARPARAAARARGCRRSSTIRTPSSAPTPCACSRATRRSPSSTSLPVRRTRRRTSAAAALETLRAAVSPAALRHALRLLDDPHPQVRAQACRTAAAVSGRASATYLVPLLADTSWWVREAAREALVAAGDHATVAASSRLSTSHDQALRSGAALVLQDIGHVDSLVGDDEVGRLERILDAGGRRLRGAAAERARRGPRPRRRAQRSRRRPRDVRDRASRRRPDVRRLPARPLAHALGAARRRARGDAAPPARARGRRRRRARPAPASRPASASSCRRTTRAPASRTRFARCSRSTTRSSR